MENDTDCKMANDGQIKMDDVRWKWIIAISPSVIHEPLSAIFLQTLNLTPSTFTPFSLSLQYEYSRFTATGITFRFFEP